MVQFSFFLSILLSRQAPSLRSRRGTSNVPSIGTFVRATLVAPVVFGSIVMQPVMGVVLTGNANCDASGAIANGALNDCTTALAHGSECTPTCDTGYVISGIRSCSGGTLIDTAVCISSPYEHGRRLLLASSWTQVGGDIDGEAADDKSGNTVSMSSDGTRMAIGAKINDNNGNDDAGHVRVYSESGGTWTQLGGDIDGEAAEDDFGYSVSMSSDGTRVAIGGRKNDGTSGSTSDNRGHVRVYEYDAAKTSAPAKWAQVGGDIDGEAAGDESGRSISMSSDGTRVAIGARWNDGTSGSTSDNRGHVRVYSESGGTWTQIGGDIDGEATGDESGDVLSISMSSDGTRVAIGASENDGSSGSGSAAGHVRVYSESGGTWTQVGGDIDGEATGDYFGRSVSMSSDGTRVAIGASGNDGTSGSTSDNRGHVRVYSESGGTWTQVGGDIDGEAAGDRAGRTVSMSADGTRVAIGATENDANRGHVRVYSESGGTWTQIGGDIDGEDALDNSGVSISMSPDGTRVAIGATQNDGSSGSDSYAGHVRVFAPFCDASVAPTNGAVGTCTNSLASGLTCQPTCDSGYTVSGTSSCNAGTLTADAGTLTAATCVPNCDASTAPTNGVVGTCTNSLASGSTCQPTCDSGYTVSGTSSCTAGTLTAATCAASPSSPAAGGSGTPAADLVLDSTPGEYGASVVLGAWFAPAQLAPLTV